jgi:pimeloyl-ACP methyl ester carboxylesterase
MAQASAQNMTNDPSKAALITEWTVHSDRKSYVYGYTDLLKLDLREKLIDIEIPTLIIACSLPDREVVSANLEKQFRNLKQKEILLVDDSKHFVMFDQPEWLYTQINKYLRSNVR